MRLSYLLTTRNKLSSLKETLTRVIACRQDDEEIIVVDGNSKDGTREYLSNLFQTHRIQQFLSEPDRGEAHGYNKAMLLARGDILKLITDDDVFSYPIIQTCKAFLCDHPHIDALGMNGVKTSFSATPSFFPLDDEEAYRTWLATGTPFQFCGLGLFLRRSSLPLLGLLHTNFVRVDAEYSLRLTSGKGTLAWYTGFGYAHLAHPLGNTITQQVRYYTDTDTLARWYIQSSRLAQFSGILLSLGHAIRQTIKQHCTTYRPAPVPPSTEIMACTADQCERWLDQQAARASGQFLTPS